MAATRTATSARSRLARLTRIYPALQGYVLLPWLLPMAALMLIDTGVVRGGWTWLLYGVSLLLAALGHRAVARWYEHTYGLVRQRSGWSFKGFVYSGLYLAGFLLLPSLLVRYAGLPDGVFGWRGILHWPFVWVGTTMVGAAFILRPYLPFLAIYGALVAALALLPLGEWFGSAGDRHLFYMFNVARVLGVVFILGYAFSAHAALVRGLRAFQRELGTPDAGSLPPSGTHAAFGEAGDDE